MTSVCHKKRLSCNDTCQDRVAPTRCADRLNATAAGSKIVSDVRYRAVTRAEDHDRLHLTCTA